MRFQFSTHALRCIDKAGGFDNYIINTKEKWLHSRTAIELKRLMFEVLKCKEQGMPMSQIKKEVFPKPKVSRHVYIPRTYDTRFYFDWKGPRKQVIFCWTFRIIICIASVINACHALYVSQGYIQQGGFVGLPLPPSPITTSPSFWATQRNKKKYFHFQTFGHGVKSLQVKSALGAKEFCSQSAKTSQEMLLEVSIKETFCFWKVYTDKGDEDTRLHLLQCWFVYPVMVFVIYLQDDTRISQLLLI